MNNNVYELQGAPANPNYELFTKENKIRNNEKFTYYFFKINDSNDSIHIYAEYSEYKINKQKDYIVLNDKNDEEITFNESNYLATVSNLLWQLKKNNNCNI